MKTVRVRQALRNGYLLGEVLWRHNQLQAVDALMPAHNADAQINNFCLVRFAGVYVAVSGVRSLAPACF
jgi:tRNA(Ile)-lysidine synthase TilS/MesJ